MPDTLRVGRTIVGYCGGLFGEDGMWDIRRVEAIGEDWVILRNEVGEPIPYLGNPEHLLQYPTGREGDEE